MSHLYKKFVNERVKELIKDISHIRNCTVIAHIDHGKTTLTDSLIADSGLLSKDVAATARLLDYDLIEQERGITIKASGITLIHQDNDKEFLIHLIDTPGHIDFSSHVTRGLRLTDGAIVVVDVIEGIMVQTETVTRQAVSELVRPILFVNKIDRLINERKLGPRKIAEEINRVVREFNAMLGKYLDDDILDEWEVSFSRGSLCIGSALDKWGVDTHIILEMTQSDDFSSQAQAFMEILTEIVDLYRKEEEHVLADKYPVADVVLKSVVRVIPDPVRAQKTRVPVIWSEVNDQTEPILECDREGPCVIVVGDVQPDRHAGNYAAVRVFSGTLVRGTPLKNLRTGHSDKTLQIGVFMSKTRVALSEVPAGNIAFITGVKGIAVGDTLVTEGADEVPPMGGLQYPTEPVVTYTIEPKKLADLGSIQEPIEEFVKTDPALEFNVNPETGEMLLSGAGELHVEISVEKLERWGVSVRLGEPMVVNKEQLSHDGVPSTKGGHPYSEFTVTAELLDDEEPRPETYLDADHQAACYLVDCTGTIKPHGDEVEWVREGFRTIIKMGPVAGERMRKLLLRIEKAELRMSSFETSWRDVTQPFLDAAKESILSGSPRLMEPWVKLEITSPEEYVGIITTILSRRKGDILEINSERALYRLIAELPVRESFGLANEIRKSTSGWATWGGKAAGYRTLRR